MELERSAERAQARGGIAAAAAFLERAAALTPDPAHRAERALDAAQAKLHAGAFEPAATLVAMAEAGPADELTRARIDLLHAHIAFAKSRGNEATPLLLAAARRLERLDVALARETTWTPSRQRYSPAAWHAARACGRWATRRAARRRRSCRGCPTGCWMPLPCVSLTATRLRRR